MIKTDSTSHTGYVALHTGYVTGMTDVLPFRSMGVSRDGYIDNVKLDLTDIGTNTPVYHITVKTLNGAGKGSAIMSSR